MREKKIHIEPADGIEIPSADHAWSNMQRKLEDENEQPVGVRWFFWSAAVLLLVAGWWFSAVYYHGQNQSAKEMDESIVAAKTNNGEKEKSVRQKSKAANSTVIDSIAVGYNQSTTLVAHSGKQLISKHENVKRKMVRRAITVGNKRATKANLKNKTMLPHLNAGGGLSDSVQKNTLAIEKLAEDTVGKSGGVSHTKEQGNGALEDQKKDVTDKLFIEAGIQWNLQVPVAGTTGYFTGTRATSQPYRLLLPALWLSVQAYKLKLTAELNPFATSVLANTPYSSKNVLNGGDIVVEHRTLHKIFGLSAGFDVDYNVQERWWLGGNIQANFWRAGTATVTTEKPGFTGGTSVIYSSNYNIADSAWVGLKKFQLGTGVQLFYRLSKWQAGLRFNYYLDAISDIQGQKNKTMLQFFIRRQLYRNKK